MDKKYNKLYAEYLEHSVRYYVLDSPVVTDDYYDKLCKELLDNWDKVTHRLKYLTDESALIAGTGFQLMYKSEIDPIIVLCKLDLSRSFKEQFGEHN